MKRKSDQLKQSLFILIAMSAATACLASDNSKGNVQIVPRDEALTVDPNLSFNPEELKTQMAQCSTALAQDLYQQMFQRSSSEMKVTYLDPDRPDEWGSRITPYNWINAIAQDGQAKFQTVGFSGSWITPKGSTFLLQIDQYGERIGFNDPFAGDARIEVIAQLVEGDIPGMSGSHLFELKGGFGAYVFEHVLSDLKYDSFGNLISSSASSTHLHITKPSENGTLPLYQMIPDGRSGTWGGVTSMSVNTVEFLNCLEQLTKN